MYDIPMIYHIWKLMYTKYILYISLPLTWKNMSIIYKLPWKYSWREKKQETQIGRDSNLVFVSIHPYSLLLHHPGYPFSHNHGSGKWGPGRWLEFLRGPVSTSMIIGGRVNCNFRVLQRALSISNSYNIGPWLKKKHRKHSKTTLLKLDSRRFRQLVTSLLEH